MGTGWSFRAFLLCDLFFSNVCLYPQKKSALFQALDHLLSQRVIDLVSEDDRFQGFYFNLFMVLKPNSSVCPILDLKKLKFHIESVQLVVASLEQKDFLALADIKDAYLHIPIFPPDQKFLRFVVEEHPFQFVGIPFGLSTALRMFTGVLALVLGLLLSQGKPVIGYLDNLLLRE